MRLSTLTINQTGLNGILDQQALLSRVQQQIATGRRILTPSDDPAGASQILSLTQAIEVTNQFQRNADIAINRISLEEITIQSVQDSLNRIRELAVQGANATLSNSDRQAIAQEVRGRLDEILGLANTRDANQEFLFSGFSVSTEPFSRNPDGSFSYNGDQGQRSLQISSGRQVSDSNSGPEVFINILNGNGRFQTLDNLTNVGSGTISPGQVTDNAAFVNDNYTIGFVTNGAGELAFNVVGANSGQVIPPLPQNLITDAPAYLAGASIAFNGLDTQISGAPVAGDTFTIVPSVRQNVFATIQDIVDGLERPNVTVSDDANVSNQLTRGLSNIEQVIENMIRIRTDIGARLNTVTTQQDINTSFVFELESTLSETQDLDLAQAATELSSRLTILEAAQTSFVSIQNLTLFNAF